MHNLITAKQIAEILGKSRQAIEKRAKKEGWKYEERPNPRGGKPIKFYYLETLPSDIKSALEQCNQFTLSNATFSEKYKPEEFTLNTTNATESVNQSVNLNETFENKSPDNATNHKNIAESVNLTNATEESIDIKEFANATSMQPQKSINATNATTTDQTNATNATESVNQCNQTNGLPEWISLNELASILDVSKMAISKRANSENWQ